MALHKNPKRIVEWETVRLGDLVKIEKGKRPKILSKTPTEEFSIPYINIKGFEQNIIDEYTNGVGCVLCDEDDFLMVWDGSRSGYVGKAIKGALGSTLVKITLPDVDHNFAYYFLQSKYLEINSRAKGVGIPHVDPNLVWNYKLPLPPHSIQKEIVSKIEELFSELDKGIEELKKAHQQLKVYRQASLKWAFEGRLTNENVKEGELQEGWKWATLGEICDPHRKCSYGVLVPGDHVENGVSLVRVGDIDDKGKIDLSNLKKISPQIASKYKRTFLHGGEVLISLVGAIGRTAVVPNSLAGANTARAIGVIPLSKEISAKFVDAMLRSPDKIREHNDSAHEVARKTLNLEDVIKSKIPLPSLNEQHQIVQEIESRFSVCDKIEELVTKNLEQADALKQGILKKAFEGNLLTNLNRV